MVVINQNNQRGGAPADGGLPLESFVEDLPAGSGEYSRYRRILDQAALYLAAGKPDSAALLLDGLAHRMVMAWFACKQGRVPDSVYLLAQLEEELSPLAWWLRLALRAPDAGARLISCRRLLDEMAGGIAL